MNPCEVLRRFDTPTRRGHKLICELVALDGRRRDARKELYRALTRRLEVEVLATPYRDAFVPCDPPQAHAYLRRWVGTNLAFPAYPIVDHAAADRLWADATSELGEASWFVNSDMHHHVQLEELWTQDNRALSERLSITEATFDVMVAGVSEHCAFLYVAIHDY